MVETFRKTSVANPVLIYFSKVSLQVNTRKCNSPSISLCGTFVWRDMGTAIPYIVEMQNNGLRIYIRLDLPLLHP